MEALVELLPLLFVAVYYLIAGRRKAKQKRLQSQASLGEADSAERVAAPTPFQSFLEQLEDSLAEANGIQAKPVPTPDPVPAPEPVPSSRLETPEFHSLKGSFDSAAPVNHERHGFGPENPLSEEIFEQSIPHAERPRGRARNYDPHSLAPPPSKSKRGNSWHARVRDPRAARDAFVLQTIFGKRGGRHGK